MSELTVLSSEWKECMNCGRVGCGTESCRNRRYEFGTGDCLNCGQHMTGVGKVVEGVVSDAYCDLCKGTDDVKERKVSIS